MSTKTETITLHQRCDYCDRPAEAVWEHYDVTVATCGDCHPDEEEN